MPRYFFHVSDGSEYTDDVGTELPGVDEVRAMATIAAGEAIKELSSGFLISANWHMWATDERGDTVCRVRFAQVQ